MCAGNADVETVRADDLQHIAAFEQGHAHACEMRLDRIIRWNRGRKDHRVHINRNSSCTVHIGHLRTTLFQLARQRRGRPVIAAHLHAARTEKPRQRTHANAADADEIHVFDIVEVAGQDSGC
jgi:hypothetical protein